MKTTTDNDGIASASVELQRAIDALSQATDAMRSTGAEMAQAAGHYARKNPLKTAGAAAAVGLLLGLLIARR
jgi:ElaB/YqjD/DUF883 family membrane-anchored ribosome-binding protein